MRRDNRQNRETVNSSAARWLLLAVSTLFWLGLLEGGARLWISRHGDALDLTADLLRADARLGWTQRRNWSGDFAGHPVATNELGLRGPSLDVARSAGRRVLALGPSSTFGWGVAEGEAYPRRLEALLQARFPGESIAVVNAGEIGYSSWQGLSFYRHGPLRALKPSIVILAYGANDPDVHRFFFDGPTTDAQALEDVLPETPIAIQNTLRRLRFFHAGTRMILRASGGLRGGRTHSTLRVPPEEFATYMRELVRSAREDGAQPILMTTASRLPAAEQALRREPARLGRDLRRYNDIVREVARAERVPLIDAQRLLEDNPGAELLDAVHPTAHGHARLANALAECVEELWIETNPRRRRRTGRPGH